MFCLRHPRLACWLACYLSTAVLGSGSANRLAGWSLDDDASVSSTVAASDRLEPVVPSSEGDHGSRIAQGDESPCSPFTRAENSERKLDPLGDLIATVQGRVCSQLSAGSSRGVHAGDPSLPYRAPLAQVRLQI